MSRAKLDEIRARLNRGETVNLTPEQAAALHRENLLEQIRAGVEVARQQPQPLTPETLNPILARYGGNFGVWALFTRIVAACTLTPAAFASGLADAYTTGHADRETALLLFRNADARQIMNAGDLAVFEALPPRLTIYRGCDVREHRAGVYGLSWTDSRTVAEFFAWRFDAADRGRVVVSCEIARPEVLAFLNTRNEREIIADVPPVPSSFWPGSRRPCIGTIWNGNERAGGWYDRAKNRGRLGADRFARRRGGPDGTRPAVGVPDR